MDEENVKKMLEDRKDAQARLFPEEILKRQSTMYGLYRDRNLFLPMTLYDNRLWQQSKIEAEDFIRGVVPGSFQLTSPQDYQGTARIIYGQKLTDKLRDTLTPYSYRERMLGPKHARSVLTNIDEALARQRIIKRVRQVPGASASGSGSFTPALVREVHPGAVVALDEDLLNEAREYANDYADLAGIYNQDKIKELVKFYYDLLEATSSQKHLRDNIWAFRIRRARPSQERGGVGAIPDERGPANAGAGIEQRGIPNPTIKKEFTQQRSNQY